MMPPKLIKTEAEHEAALARLDELMDAEPGTAECEELELLAHLVEHYEKAAFPIDAPTPAEAIRFRMEQQGLSQSEIAALLEVPRSRISEYLGGKRPLTLEVARALHEKLQIPAESLLGEHRQLPPCEFEWKKFPIKEMASRNWFPRFFGPAAQAVESAEELMRGLMAKAGVAERPGALLRQSERARTGPAENRYALDAWLWRVTALARERCGNSKIGPFNRESLHDGDFLRSLVGLSQFEEGPLLAARLLAKHGVCVVTEPHLKGTHLDGAAFCTPEGTRVIALTLRHDRTDAFWFTLLHELAHVCLHLDDQGDPFLDDLDQSSSDEQEAEADAWAADTLIPAKQWDQLWSRWKTSFPARTDVISQARKLNIDPAILAGRYRKESQNFHIHAPLLKSGAIRRMFQTGEVAEDKPGRRNSS